MYNCMSADVIKNAIFIIPVHLILFYDSYKIVLFI
jgi:hypothetical protein